MTLTLLLEFLLFGEGFLLAFFLACERGIFFSFPRTLGVWQGGNLAFVFLFGGGGGGCFPPFLLSFCLKIGKEGRVRVAISTHSDSMSGAASTLMSRPQSANPGEAARAPWWSSQSSVAG